MYGQISRDINFTKNVWNVVFNGFSYFCRLSGPKVSNGYKESKKLLTWSNGIEKISSRQKCMEKFLEVKILLKMNRTLFVNGFCYF